MEPKGTVPARNGKADADDDKAHGLVEDYSFKGGIAEDPDQ